MRPLIVHIGLPKTGTTSLQRELFVRHPQLALIGKPLNRLHAGMQRLFSAMLRLEPWEYRRVEPELVALIPELLDRPGDTVLISEEELATGTLGARVDRLTIARRLSRLFPAAEIVFTIREQGDAMRSMYGELCRLGAVDAPFPRWAAHTLALPETAAGLHLFRYDELLELYGELFERVHVTVYEELREHPEVFIRGLSDILRVDADEAWRLFEQGVTHNPSRTAEFWPERHLSAVHDRFAASNHRLAAATGLDLCAHGYSLGA